MYFNLKNNTVGITYKDDGQVPKGKTRDGKIVNSNITFKKPFKLQIRASKMIDGKKTIKKKTITYPVNTTLLNAIENASKIYKEMMIDIENNVMIEKTELHPAMLFSEAFEAYVNYKEEEYKSNSTKTDYNSKGAYAFYDNYLKPIHKRPLNQIKPRDITALKNAKGNITIGRPINSTKLSPPAVAFPFIAAKTSFTIPIIMPYLAQRNPVSTDF